MIVHRNICDSKASTDGSPNREEIVDKNGVKDGAWQ